MNMFARFDENPAMTLRVINETELRTDARADGQRENSIPPTNKVCGGYNSQVLAFTYGPQCKKTCLRGLRTTGTSLHVFV